MYCYAFGMTITGWDKRFKWLECPSYIYIEMFKSVRTDITSSVCWMWTIRFTYFNSKRMHLSKLLHNQWSTCIGTDVVTSVRTDVNETVNIYIYIYILYIYGDSLVRTS